jgi:hypothetical protein
MQILLLTNLLDYGNIKLPIDNGASPSGKASVFGADIRWFESIRPSQFCILVFQFLYRT